MNANATVSSSGNLLCRRHHRMHIAGLAAGVIAAGGACGTVHAQVASALLREAAQLPNAPAGYIINSINNPDANHVPGGGYAFQVNTSNGLAHFWGNPAGGAGSILRTEGTFGTVVQTAFESFWGLSDAGKISYSATGTGGPVGGFDSVWVDDNAVAMEGSPVPSLPGQFFVFASRPGITADGRPHWVSGFTSVPGGATQNRGLFMDNGATAVLIGGQVVPDLPFPLNTGTAVAFGYRFSSLAGHYIAPVIIASGSTANDGAMTMDGAGLMVGGSLVREGSPVPAAIGGLVGELWANFEFVDATECGEFYFTGDTNAATTVDEFICINGQIVYREGQVVDGRTLTGAINHAYMNEQGDVAFVWPIVSKPAAVEALFVNGHIVLSEGDAVDLDGDGNIEPNSILQDFTGISALVISDRVAGQVTLYFTADIDTLGTPSTTDDTEGGFRLTVPFDPCPSDVNNSNGTDLDDLLLIINEWDQGAASPADINADCTVNIDDLLIVVNGFGPCS